MIIKVIVLLVMWFAILRFAVPTPLGRIVLSIPYVVLIVMAFYIGEMK